MILVLQDTNVGHFALSVLSCIAVAGCEETFYSASEVLCRGR